MLQLLESKIGKWLCLQLFFLIPLITSASAEGEKKTSARNQLQYHLGLERGIVGQGFSHIEEGTATGVFTKGVYSRFLFLRRERDGQFYYNIFLHNSLSQPNMAQNLYRYAFLFESQLGVGLGGQLFEKHNRTLDGELSLGASYGLCSYYKDYTGVRSPTRWGMNLTVAFPYSIFTAKHTSFGLSPFMRTTLFFGNPGDNVPDKVGLVVALGLGFFI